MLERCCENEDTAQRAALSGCLVQPVLLTVAVELPHEIPYSLPNAIDVADPPALILLHISSTFGIDHIKSISEDMQNCRGGPRYL